MNPPKMAELGLTPKTGFLTIITVVLEGVLTEKGRLRDRQGEKETGRQGSDGKTGRQGDRERRKERDKETGGQGDKKRGEREKKSRENARALRRGSL